MISRCASSGLEFELTPEDENFYRRVSPAFMGEKQLIPTPAFSPQARLVRRMTWRNDRTFFRRRCSLSGKDIIAIYPADTPFPVYHPSEWWSDKWNPESFGRDVSFKRPFFEQWCDLMTAVPRLGVDIVNCENSDYCNYCGDDKNCYLDIAGEANEDCYFNLFTKYSKNCVDCTFVYNSQLVYQSINCYNCYEVVCGYYLEDCSNCDFCFDLKGCRNCLFCSNLRRKEYHISNRPVTREEYEAAIRELRKDSFAAMERHAAGWREVIRNAIHRDMYNLNSEECTGDNIKNSKNCLFCFNVTNCWDCKYLYDVLDARDCYDLNYSLYNPELSLELISTLSMKFSAFCMASHYCTTCFYCDQCNNSQNLFGCIGMNQKQYCILNKQYSREDYEKTALRLTGLMKETGEWGQFFPSALSPWGYNETVAQEYFPLSEREARAQGFNWREGPKSGATEGKSAQIPDSISAVDDSILGQVLRCSVTGKPYRLAGAELQFYRQMGLAIPRKAPDTRHLERLQMRNPRVLYRRKCSKTGADIMTTYAPDRPEKVYSTAAYFAEVV